MCPPSASRPPSQSIQCNLVRVTRASRLQIQHPVAPKTLSFLRGSGLTLTTPQRPLEHLNLPGPRGNPHISHFPLLPSTTQANEESSLQATAEISFLPPHFSLQQTHHSNTRHYLQNISRVCLVLIPASPHHPLKNTVPLQSAQS